MSYQTVRYEVDDAGVAVATLDRPEHRNALDSVMRREIVEVFARTNDDPNVRALVLTGAGEEYFSAGADQKERASGGAMPSEQIRRNHLHPTNALSARLQQVEKPVVAAVNGTCVGGGLALAAGCDVVLASENARFRVAHAALGVGILDALGWLLPRHIGPQRTFELYATNRIMDAAEAKEAGLVFKVTSSDELMPEALKLARAFAAGPPLGMTMTKRAILRGRGRDLDDYLEFERLAYQVCYYSEDSKEARRAFIERRKPKYQGR